MRPDHAIALVLFILWSLACGWIGYYVTRPAEPVAQVYAPEVRTSPADAALEVKPGAVPSLPAPTPARGGRVVSTTEVTVSGQKPRVRKPLKREHDTGNVSKPATCPTVDDFECPPLDLRLDLIEVDGQQYMAVRGPDGVEVTGQYLPRAPVAAVRRNRATLIRTENATTLTVTRDAGRLSYGLALAQDDRLTAGVVVGLAW